MEGLALTDLAIEIDANMFLDKKPRNADENLYCSCVQPTELYHSVIAVVLQMSFMLLTGGRMREMKRVLHVGNSIVAHAFLLDQRGVVRWYAHATPTTRELQALSKCTRQLLEQNRK